jgi:hypothetical protein
LRTLVSGLFLLSILSPFASAQSFNVDVGDNLIIFPVPVDSYGAAANQIGRWNASIHPYSTNLVNLDGSASAVTTSSTNSSSYNYFPSTLTGEDRNFMIDIQTLPSIGGPWFWTITGLQDGHYSVYTYAWAPENNGVQTRVQVSGSSDPAQLIGGSWVGSPHVLGTTYALHQVDISGGIMTLQVEGVGGSSGSINGFQLVFGGGPVSTYCFGDGSGTACPCGNSGTSGNGCANSVNPAGAHLGTLGSPSVANDTLLLVGSGMPDSSVLYFQGTLQSGAGSGVVFGDGLRCVAGTVVRLGTKTNAGGSSVYPSGGDQSVSVRGLVSAGDVRNYQVWYRNAANFCTISTFNLSNGVQVSWQP